MAQSPSAVHPIQLPPILYGTAWKKSATATLVSTALRAGFRGFDTACQPKHYDEAGVGLGLALAGELGLARDSFYLQTKFTPLPGQDPRRVPYDAKASLREQIRQSCACSLENLRTEYLDCLLLHSLLADHTQTLHAWRALEALVDEGAIRSIGLSNCHGLDELAHLYAAARIKPAVLQNRFYRDSGYDRELRDWCRAHRIVYQSFWTLTANPHLLAHPTLTAVAAASGRSAAQILLRYVTQREVVPLTGTRSEQHMHADLAIFDFELTARELRAIDALL